MARWLVKLEGANFDLEDFPYWFPSGPALAMSDSDGTYLTGEVLESCVDASAVLQTAEALLDEMHAVVCLLEPSIRRPTIGAVLREDDNGERRGTVFASVQIGGRSKLRATLSSAVESGSASQETQAQALLRVAQASRHLRIALSLLALPHVSWPHLYRALEEIEAALGMTVCDAGLCSANARSRFTRSANSGEIAGTDARHRVGKFDPPADPMTLRHAQAFLRACLDSTLRRALGAT
jgi:hypothetical protein